MLFRVLIVFASLATIGGCQTKTLSLDDYYHFIEDSSNGFIQKVSADDLTITVKLVPVEIIFAKQLQLQQQANLRVSLDSLIDLYRDHLYFKVSLSFKGKPLEYLGLGDEQRYVNIQQYLSGEICSQWQVLANDQVIAPLDCIYVPGYNLSASTEVVVVFESPLLSQSQNIQVEYNDGYFHSGKHVFTFSMNKLQKRPRLTITI